MKRTKSAFGALRGEYSLSRAEDSSQQAKPIFVSFVSFVVNLTDLLILSHEIACFGWAMEAVAHNETAIVTGAQTAPNDRSPRQFPQ
jgi:hypothetical protein